MNLTNEHNIPLYLAVWLLQDNYDYINNPKYISATSLLKPIKETVLSKRVDKDLIATDLIDLTSRRLGSTVHDSVEHSWVNPENLEKALSLMGYSLDQVAINEKNPGDRIPVYLEQRRTKSILGYSVGGKYDFVFDGILHDLKTTSAFSWVYADRDEDYKLQGSIYRWLNPDIITEDFIRITFLFTDWKANMVKEGSNYPDARIKSKDIQLYSLKETEQWLKERISLIAKQSAILEEEDMTPCTPKEMWLSDPVWKYYSKESADPATSRATKNFTNPMEAYAHLQKKGVGKVVEIPGEAKKCQQYCSAFLVCKQGQSQYKE